MEDNKIVKYKGYIRKSAINILAWLENNPNPTEEEIRHGLEGNFCRCTGYHNIVKSVKAAAESMQGGA